MDSRDETFQRFAGSGIALILSKFGRVIGASIFGFAFPMNKFERYCYTFFTVRQFSFLLVDTSATLPAIYRSRPKKRAGHKAALPTDFVVATDVS